MFGSGDPLLSCTLADYAASFRIGEIGVRRTEEFFVGNQLMKAPLSHWVLSVNV